MTNLFGEKTSLLWKAFTLHLAEIKEPLPNQSLLEEQVRYVKSRNVRENYFSPIGC